MTTRLALEVNQDSWAERELVRDWLTVEAAAQAERLVAHYLAPPPGVEAEYVAEVRKEAQNLRSCLNLYRMLRLIDTGDVSVHEVRTQLRAEQVRWAREYASRDFSGAVDYSQRRAEPMSDDEQYVTELRAFLAQLVDSRIRDAYVRFSPLPASWEFQLGVRGTDAVSAAWLEVAKMMLEREPVATCEAPDCGRIYARYGKKRFCSTQCADRTRQRRVRARTHARTHKPVGAGGIRGTSADLD